MTSGTFESPFPVEDREALAAQVGIEGAQPARQRGKQFVLLGALPSMGVEAA